MVELTESNRLDICKKLLSDMLLIKYENTIDSYETTVYKLFKMINCDVSIFRTNQSIVFEGCVKFDSPVNNKSFYNITGYISLKNSDELFKETIYELVFAYYCSLNGNKYQYSHELLKVLK